MKALLALFISSFLKGVTSGERNSLLQGQARCHVASNILVTPVCLLLQQQCSSYHLSNLRGSCLELRGGDGDVLPAAGPPSEDGKLKSCAQCGALETRMTLGYCKITYLYFCAKTECRRKHWLSNQDFWRERAAKV